MLRSLIKRWTGRLPLSLAEPAGDRRARRRKAYLTVETLESRDCPSNVFPGDTISGVATLHSTDPDETGEGEPAQLTNTTGSFQLTISAYETPTPFSFKAAALNDNVASRILGEDGDETVDVSITVNGKSALTINQKQALANTASNVNTGSNVLWVIAGGCALGILFTGGTAAPIALPWCAGIAGTLAGGVGEVGNQLNKQASDPPDFKFNRITQVKEAPAPHVVPGNGISKPLAKTIDNWLKNEAKITSLFTALTTTENRISAAGLANSKKALNKQLKVARKFRHQIASALLKDVSFRIKVSAGLRAAGIPFPTLTPDQVMQIESMVSSTNQPPAQILAGLQAAGLDALAIQTLTKQFIVADTKAVAAASIDPIANPTILASIQSAAAAIRAG
jgi:hypothetical protein